MKLNKRHLLLLSISSGILLSIAWPLRGFPLIALIALIPLFAIEDHVHHNRSLFRSWAVFRYSFIGIFIWNALTTWWIWHATEIGSVLALLLNSLFMALIWQLFHYCRKFLRPDQGGMLIFPFFWIAFEYLHMHWDLSWSWLNLGNVFATRIELIQWYEITGTLGGSLWILLSNIMIFSLLRDVFIKQQYNKKSRIWLSGITLILLLGPAAWSLQRYYSYTEKSDPVDVVVIQPNIDPYKEEYIVPPIDIMHRVMQLVREKADSNVDFYVVPESVLQEECNEEHFESSEALDSAQLFLSKMNPEARFVIGAGTVRFYKEGNERPTATARKLKMGGYYDAYNTALFVDSTEFPQVYHKSKLVPGVEQMPFIGVIRPIEKLAINLGGTVGSLGKNEERTVFTGGVKPVSPIICYESIYGEFVNGFVRNGAELLFIITNDGWWQNTAGHRQHFSYAPLRAIETRRCIARSANNGISCFINQRGDVFQPTTYWTRAVIRMELNANKDLTFYVRFGDYLGRMAAFGSLLLLLITIAFRIKSKVSAKN